MSSGTPDSPQVVRSFDPDRDGMCGNQAPAVLIGIAPPVCGLRWGHRGWHEAEDGSKWSREAAELPSSVAVSGLTPGSERDRTPGERTGDLGADLVATFATHRTGTFEDLAQALLEAGWRRVSVDDDTVERVARAIWASKWRVPDATDRAWERAKSRTTEHHVAARAAVQALRGGSDG